MPRTLAIAAVAALVFASTVEVASSDAPRVRGGFSIQIHRGPELLTLVALDGDIFLIKGRSIGTRQIEEGVYKRYPYKDKDWSALWRFDQTDKGFTIQVFTEAEKNLWYLGYDPEAPEKGVSLREKLTAGCYWDVGLGPRAGRTTKVRARDVAAGEWWLGFDEDGEEYLKGEQGGSRYIHTLYKLRLTEAGSDFTIDRPGK